MDSQGSKFMAMLGEVVRMVQDPERFEPALVESGRRHTQKGADMGPPRLREV
jgi:hypothetical protein